jgi:hypothetical protein
MKTYVMQYTMGKVDMIECHPDAPGEWVRADVALEMQDELIRMRRDVKDFCDRSLADIEKYKSL